MARKHQVKRMKDLEAENTRLCRAGGFPTPTSCAARASREANHELTFALDQSLGADHKCQAK